MASIAEFDKIVSEIKSRKFQPIYFLEGEESYFIDKVADLLEESVLTEAEKGFNYQAVYGKDSNINDIISAAKRFPMMAEYQLIMVREAQYLKTIDALLDYCENPVKSTVLVFLYKGKKVNKATKLGKELKKFGLFTTAKLYDNEVAGWLAAHCKSLGITIAPQAAQVLLQTLGSDLNKISGEIEKAKANLGSRKQIEMDDLAKGGGIDKEYNVFELTKSIGKRDLKTSLQIVKYFGQNTKDNPFVLVLINLYNYFKKVHLIHFQKTTNSTEIARAVGLSPYFVTEYITAAKNYQPAKISQVFSVLHEFDLRSKGIEGGKSEEGELLTEMVARIIK
ncbi:MAG: DNA polymerase III subunit delta [Flavobacteriales bacterium]|nr:DNA polymerase III subunit delta [Flavobacteriales bacterium]